jgi:ribosomal protein S18 acetylase RimI-like enzyme
MHPLISSPTNDLEWGQVIQLLKRVYVGDGYSTSEGAEVFMRRENLEPGGEILLARSIQGSVIGAALFLHPHGPLAQMARNDEAEFRVLAVAPEARGRGAGEALVKACIARAQAAGASGLVLWTQPTMKAAHRLYERIGFVRVADRDELDPRGFMRLVYRRDLPLA